MTLTTSDHISVLPAEVLNDLVFEGVKTVFDGTLGLGGHAESILKNQPELECYIGCDLDEQHLSFAQERLKPWKEKTHFHLGNFSDIAEVIDSVKPAYPLVILLDLGFCSNQVDDPDKGFSFLSDGPLNMSFGEEYRGRCEALINEGTQQEITHILKAYGEEPLAKTLSQKIIEARQHNPIKTTQQLRAIVEENTYPQKQKKTLMRVFQAFRIATNQELEHLEKALRGAASVMRSGDRIGVMSFHSLEDRIVKQFFKAQCTPPTKETVYSVAEPVGEADWQLVTRKPLKPTEEEVASNPRSRSVKFRIAQKI